MPSSLNLFNAGLTNKGSEDYGVIASGASRKTYHGFCTSVMCCRLYKDHKTKKKKDGTPLKVVYYAPNIFVTTNRNADNCPNCRSRLFWKEA